MTRALTVLTIIGSFTLAACGADGPDPDGGARLACGEFRSLSVEDVDGEITVAAMNDRLTTVASRSRASDDETVRRLAAELSESATPGRAPSPAAVSAFDGRCAALDL
jgi:hypothetical protein